MQERLSTMEAHLEVQPAIRPAKRLIHECKRVPDVQPSHKNEYSTHEQYSGGGGVYDYYQQHQQ